MFNNQPLAERIPHDLSYLGFIAVHIVSLITISNTPFFFFSSRRRHTRWNCDWSSDVCSSDLVQGEVGANRVGVVLAQPLQPEAVPDLLVGAGREDEVARGLEALPRERGERHRLRGDLPLHVERAAAPDLGAANLARPGIRLPLRRVGDDGVRVGQEQQARPTAAPGQPRDEVRALGGACLELALDAVPCEVVAQQLGRLRLVPGRVDRVEPDELLQELGDLVAERHGGHEREHTSGVSDLFADAARERMQEVAPLALRLRPRSLDEFVGQEQVLGERSALRLAIAEDRVGSAILYGPPGTGKTTLARIVAETTGAAFEELSAVSATVKDVREVLARARERLGGSRQRTILFLDEIHRFNKAQQDALLPAVEEGLVTLIGATTENPYFEVNSALLSRAQVIELRGLSDEDLETLLRRALPELGDGARVDDDALAFLAARAGGDARSALGALELAAETAQHVTL